MIGGRGETFGHDRWGIWATRSTRFARVRRGRRIARRERRGELQTQDRRTHHRIDLIERNLDSRGPRILCEVQDGGLATGLPRDQGPTRVDEHCLSGIDIPRRIRDIAAVDHFDGCQRCAIVLDISCHQWLEADDIRDIALENHGWRTATPDLADRREDNQKVHRDDWC